MFEFKVKGLVQGVGFRPYIYNSANYHGLIGFVQNTKDGIKIVCDDKIAMNEILRNPPKLAKIESITINPYTQDITKDYFEIKESEKKSSYSSIPADLNLCDDCKQELFNPKNYRYKYFFISCTNCGPRYSIIRQTPYDRDKTALKEFEMCNICKSEYENPQNRRYHAQTVACHTCGPKLALYENGKVIESLDPIEKTIELLKQDEIIAIKGVGGFHLVCLAKREPVLKLRQITKRKYKPFALLGKNIQMVQDVCHLSEKEKEILESAQRPIVLLQKKQNNTFCDISELSSLGFMLPSNPIQYLLFEDLNLPLVMTSSNMPNHPITTIKEKQFVKYVLDYNRDIENFVDDSILKVIDGNEFLIRRSRGYAPNEIKIPLSYQNYKSDILGVGAEMKNTFCIKKKDKLILSQHIGNTYNADNFDNFINTTKKLITFTKANPKAILCDINSEFNTSQFAKEYSKEKKIDIKEVQHHLAHAFGVAIEHDLNDFLAIVCDGTGLGLDSTIWGGEVFHNDKLIGRLEKQTLIGCDMANKYPIRMLVGILSKFTDLDGIREILCGFDDNKKKQIKEEMRIKATKRYANIKTFYKQKVMNFNCIESSSAGRILDCVSVLLGFHKNNFYEGRGAMILEGKSSDKVKLFLRPIIERSEEGILELKTTPLIKFIADNMKKIPKDELARFTQVYIAKGLYEITQLYDSNLPVTFSGGCAYNNIMTSFMLKQGVLINKEIPCGDGGISFGQIAYFLWKEGRK